VIGYDRLERTTELETALESSAMDDAVTVTCPYCGEDLEIYVEPDVRGTFVQDCEVCCNPWLVRVEVDADDRYVTVGRADGSE
jgi:Cysteine-rich CPXCG